MYEHISPPERPVSLYESLTRSPTTFGSGGGKYLVQGGTTLEAERLLGGFEVKRATTKQDC